MAEVPTRADPRAAEPKRTDALATDGAPSPAATVASPSSMGAECTTTGVAVATGPVLSPPAPGVPQTSQYPSTMEPEHPG